MILSCTWTRNRQTWTQTRTQGRDYITALMWSSMWATCEMTAAGAVYAVLNTIWSLLDAHEQCWCRSGRRPCCTRIHHPLSGRSCYSTCDFSTRRCRGHTCWTAPCRGTTMHRQHCPRTRIPEVGSFAIHRIQRTFCTRRRPSCYQHATVGQPSSCSGRSVSADWAVRCRASSCLSCR